MKLSKKITAILFSALLCAALFAGCVKDTDSDTDAGELLFTTGEEQTEDPSGYAQLSYDAQTDLYSLPGGQVYRLSGISYEPVAIGQGAAGFGDGGQDEELRLELQQRDTIIQMKTEEIRRLSLQNHDLENEVDFLSFDNDVVAKTEDEAG